MYFSYLHVSTFTSADVMSGQGPQTVISVDVGAEDNNDIMNYGDHLSGWWLLWNKYNPFATTVRVGCVCVCVCVCV